MMAIPFTQYLRPNGRRRDVEIDRPSDIEALARQFIESGGRYECEHLTTEEASLTAVKEIDGEEQDVAIEIVPNGPEVPAAVDRLVRASAARFADTECANQK
jgi:hypothetical protein